MKSGNQGEVGKSGVRGKQAFALDRWEKFLAEHRGCYPASLAAARLRMTPQGVYQAAERGWITFFSVGRCRFYSRKDVLAYRFNVSRKFRDCHAVSNGKPLDYAQTS